MAFATKELARGLASPTVQHRTALKHTLRFLAGTAGTGLMLKPTTTLSKETRHKAELTIYTDSDWAGCKTTRKSTTGTVVQLLGCAIQHCPRTQMTLALSSTEAETYAVCTGLSEALFLRQLLLETKLFTTVELHLYTDSTGARATSPRTGLGPKTKHIHLRYLWIQDCFQQGLARLRKVHTKDNCADILTKFTTVETLNYLKGKSGLTNNIVTLNCVRIDWHHIDNTLTDVTDVPKSSEQTTENSLKHCKRATVIPNPKEFEPYDEVKINTGSLKQSAFEAKPWAHLAMAPLAEGFTVHLSGSTRKIPGTAELRQEAEAMASSSERTVMNGTAADVITEEQASSAMSLRHNFKAFLEQMKDKKTVQRRFWATAGNVNFKTGCYHTEEKCPGLLKATTDVIQITDEVCKNAHLRLCRYCAAREEVNCEVSNFSLKARPLTPNDSDKEEDDEQFIFTVNTDQDIITDMISHCETEIEKTLLSKLTMMMKMSDEPLTDQRALTGYYWTVSELSEASHLITHKVYFGEMQAFGNWSIWTDPGSALIHWMFRYKTGTETWKLRKRSVEHVLIGWRLSCRKTVNMLTSKNWKTFNREFHAFSLTGNEALELNTTEWKTVTVLNLNFNINELCELTKNCLTHCQLIWDSAGHALQHG